MGDGAIIRVRRYARVDAVRLFLSNGNGFAIDGYYPFWGPLLDRFEAIVFDFRNHGQNPLAASGRDGHTYAQMALDLEGVVRGVTRHFGPRRCAGVFHSMSARTAMKHAIEIGFPWEALILFDPPNVPPPGHRCYETMDVFEHRLADWALSRPDRFADPSELARHTPPKARQVYAPDMGRTNIVLDEQLIRQAMKLTGARTKREAVDIALRAIVAQSSAQQALLRLRGKLPWKGDPIALRRAGR